MILGMRSPLVSQGASSRSSGRRATTLPCLLGQQTMCIKGTTTDFLDSVIAKVPALKKRIIERSTGSALKSVVERFRNSFSSRKQPGEKVLMGSMIKALYDFCDLKHKV